MKKCLQDVYNIPGQIELDKITWIHTYKRIQILSTIKISSFICPPNGCAQKQKCSSVKYVSVNSFTAWNL